MSENGIVNKPRLKQIRYDLRKKISTVMAGVLFINAIIILIFSSWWSMRSEEQVVLRYGKESLTMLKNFITTRSGSLQSSTGGTRRSIETYLNSLYEAVPYFRYLYVYDESGALIAKTSEHRGEEPRRLGLAELERLAKTDGRWLNVVEYRTRGGGRGPGGEKTRPETVYIQYEFSRPDIDWRNNILPNIVVILVLTVLALLIAYAWAKKMARPLREVIQVADEVAQGQAFREVKVKSSDEAGVIAGLFNVINKRLQDRINDMAMLQLWSMDIGAELDREELNNIIVTTFANATGARRVALLLRDRQAGTLTVAAGIHVVNPRLCYPDTTGLAGAVIASDNFVLTNDMASYADAALFHADPQALKAGVWYLGLPVIAQGRAIGVLILGDRAVDGDKEFDAESVILFQTLATSAGGALDNARLYDLAITDELTRVYIRRFYNQRLNEEVETAVNEQSSLSLIMLDIDHFKRFNDTYGHQTGDRVLVALANLLRDTVRGIDVQEAERRRDIVARYGGEEFSVILPNTPLAGGMLVAERLRYNIENFSELRSDDGKQLSITISLGVAEWQPGQQPEHLIHCADEALYEAKHRGRNRVVSYPFAGAESATPA